MNPGLYRRNWVTTLPILVIGIILSVTIVASQAVDRIDTVTSKEANTITNIESKIEGDVLKIIMTANGDVPSYKSLLLYRPTRLAIDFFHANKAFPQNLIEVDSPYVQRIRIGTHPDKLRVCLDLSEEQLPPHHIINEENRLVVIMGQNSEAESESDDEEVKETSASDVGDGNSKVVSATPVKSRVSDKPVSDTKRLGSKVENKPPELSEAPIELPGTPKRYRGTKISMDFYNADVHNVFRLISDISGLNIVVGDEVKGNVTIRLLDVPWDQALDLVLATQGLGMVRVGNVIRIAPAETLRKEQDMARQAAEARLDTLKKKEELEPLITEYIQVNYARAEDLVPRVEEILSDRGRVTSDERTNMLVVHDIRKSIKNIKFLVRTLDRTTPQVMIEARIVEAEVNFARELGVRWQAGYFREVRDLADTPLYFERSNVLSDESTPFMNDQPFLGLKGLEPEVNLPVSSPAGSIGFAFQKMGRDIWNIDVQLSALEQEGKVKIISAPKVVTLDNKEALIKQGKEIPYLEFTEEGTVSTVFKEIVLQLAVTPHITPDGRVKMKIKTKKDELDNINAVVIAGGLVPAVDKKEAETELLVDDGETVVIGGVIREKEDILITRVPLLWKIPILGRLFQRRAVERQKTELLIFIAPNIIKEEDKLTLGEDGCARGFVSSL
jgi:type IV pilus assembly protein PilQ